MTWSVCHIVQLLLISNLVKITQAGLVFSFENFRVFLKFWINLFLAELELEK